jgi:hypothetical protein
VRVATALPTCPFEAAAQILKHGGVVLASGRKSVCVQNLLSSARSQLRRAPALCSTCRRMQEQGIGIGKRLCDVSVAQTFI